MNEELTAKQKLENLIDAMCEDITELSDEEILAEMIEDGEGPEVVAARGREIIAQAIAKSRSVMTDEATVERAARAILEASLWPGAWQKANDSERSHATHAARAAIGVMPEWDEIERLRDIIDCGCNAIEDAINLGGGDLVRISAMVRRMRREAVIPTPPEDSE